MVDTSFDPGPALAHRTAPVHGTEAWGEGALEYFVGTAAPGGGLWSTAADVVHFGQAFANGAPGRHAPARPGPGGTMTGASIPRAWSRWWTGTRSRRTTAWAGAKIASRAPCPARRRSWNTAARRAPCCAGRSGVGPGLRLPHQPLGHRDQCAAARLAGRVRGVAEIARTRTSDDGQSLKTANPPWA